MFDNLVESSSHKKDIERKGSFIIVTAVIYLVLLVAFFVAGIYWYDNHLGEMELELTTLVAPVPLPHAKQPDQNEDRERVDPAVRHPEVPGRAVVVRNDDDRKFFRHDRR